MVSVLCQCLLQRQLKSLEGLLPLPFAQRAVPCCSMIDTAYVSRYGTLPQQQSTLQISCCKKVQTFCNRQVIRLT